MTESHALGISNSKDRGAVKHLLFFVLFIALTGLASCGAAPASTAVTCTVSASTTAASSSTNTCTDPVTSISLSISPATVSVNVVTTQQFQDFIQGGTNNVTIWKVNGITGGDDTVGRIDSNGLFHAPAKIPSPATVTVAAVSFEDANLSAPATVTITAAPTVAITSPSGPVTVSSGIAQSVTFNAVETGGTTSTILWYAGPVGGLGILGGNSTVGTISANGVYTPPLTPPIGQTITVTAVAQDSPGSTASLPVTIAGYSTSSLEGRFAFSLSGNNNSSGRFFRAGSFVADAAGGLNSVIEDVNSGASSPSSPIFTTGSYTLGADGRGTLQFNDGLTPASFDFVLVNGSQLQIIGFDASGTASGQANAQDASTFVNTPLSALSGTYAFDFAGVDGSNGLSQVGEFSVDGAGTVTNGTIDINDGGTLNQYQIAGNAVTCSAPPSSLSTYSVASNGRGTLALTTCAGGPALTLNFYVVSRGSAKFVGTDAVKQVAGLTSKQVSNVTFDNTALNGNYAFLLTGSSPSGPIATAGSFLADGSGNITSGLLDENVNGTPSSSLAFQSGGTYALASNGRGTATFKTSGRTYTLVFYMGATGSAVFQNTSTGYIGDGNFALQQSAPFTLASIIGNYALETSGTSGAALQVSSGQFGADGAGAVTTGELDVNTGGSLTPAQGQPVTGLYTAPAANGRAVFTLNSGTLNYAGYVVSPTQVFLLGIQPGQLAAGTLLRQF